MKKYRASKYGTIEHLEVVKETDKQVVFINKRKFKSREAKISDWNVWTETFQEAKAWVVKRQKEKVTDLEEKLEFARKQLLEFENLEEGVE